jgi:hypothetical protein
VENVWNFYLESSALIHVKWGLYGDQCGRAKAWNIFFRSNTGIMGSNHTESMDVCLRLFCVCFVLCR